MRMCGRYALKADPKVLATELGITQATLDDGMLATPAATLSPIDLMAPLAFAANYNIAPTHLVPAVVERENAVTLTLLRWGLIPSWAKDDSAAASMINARAETVETKPSYRSAVAKRRALVPADGWYEWHREGTGSATKKQPYYFSRLDEKLLTFAAIFERWSPPDADPVWSVSLLTTQADPELAHVHDRMPVLVPASRRREWIAAGRVDVASFVDQAVPASELALWPVDTAVGNIRNNRPSLLEAIS